MRHRSRVLLLFATLLLATFIGEAKKAPLKPVTPVESNGIRYSAIRNGPDQYVAATDIATGKQLWKVKVFHTNTKPRLEPDVQWVFVTDLSLVGSSLFVRDEMARCFVVDLRDHLVRKAACRGVFAENLKFRASDRR